MPPDRAPTSNGVPQAIDTPRGIQMDDRITLAVVAYLRSIVAICYPMASDAAVGLNAELLARRAADELEHQAMGELT